MPNEENSKSQVLLPCSAFSTQHSAFPQEGSMRDGSSLGRGKRVIQLVAPRDTQAAQILTASGHLEDRLQEAGLRSVRPHELRLVRGVGWVLKHTKLLVNLIDSRNTAYFAQVHRVYE